MDVKDIRHVAVIGTGMIGTSMAVLLSGHGVKTTLYALSEELIQKSRREYRQYMQALVERGYMTVQQVAICETYLSYTMDYQDIAAADYVVECVTEDVKEKFDVYAKLEKYCENPRVIFSTTSALSVDDLAEGLHRFRDRFAVAHPFNPPHLVPFFEVVKNRQARADLMDTLVPFLEALDREVCVLKKSAPGFIANRLQHALFREALYIVENGIADPRDVDKAAMYSFMPRYTSIGIFEHFDNSGVDLNYNIENYLFRDLSAADKAPKYVCDLMEQKAYGVKAGRGVYDWSETDMDDFRERISAPYWKYFNWKLPEK